MYVNAKQWEAEKSKLCFEIEIRVSFTFSLTQEKVGKSD
jgi:hypothetical protein